MRILPRTFASSSGESETAEQAVEAAETAGETTKTTGTIEPTTVSSPRLSSSSDDMVGWHTLPAELRSLVLKFAIGAALQKPKAHNLSAYAVVCKEWQELVEQINFESIKIVSSDLTDFEALITGPRRKWMRHLWFKVELAKYSKKKSKTPETEEEQQANEILFTTDINSLFETLAKWKVDDCPHGLEFELSARSPSDTQAFAGSSGLTDDGDSRYFDSHLDFAFLDTGWVGPHGIPTVDVITKFSILRRCWRNIDPQAFLTIISSLPRLAELRYEPSQQFDDGAQEVLDMDRTRTIPFWPKTIRRLSLFEHFDPLDEDKTKDEEDDGFEDDNGSEDGEGDANETEPRICPALAWTLARRSLQLEELAVSFMADARHFFQPFMEVRAPRQAELPYWPSLKWLALTSSAIHYDIDPDRLNETFLAAARAAKRMPALRALELFNTCKHSGGVFRYVVLGNKASISWEGTWDFQVSSSVKKAWREVARLNASAELVVERRQIKNEGMFKFVHRRLATRDLILHPISSADMMGKKAVPAPKLKLR